MGKLPCTRALTPKEIQGGYEKNTGGVIVEKFKKLNPLERPAVLVASHGPFTWGRDVDEAAHNAVVLEFVARLAGETLRINPRTRPMSSVLARQTFLGNTDPHAQYGQKQ